MGWNVGLLHIRYNRAVLYVWMTKKKISSAGILKSVGPTMALGGYVQILWCIKYESQGVVETTAILFDN